jgi:hypothetical protein
MEDWGGFIDQFVGEMRGVFREHNKGAESVKASLLVRSWWSQCRTPAMMRDRCMHAEFPLPSAIPAHILFTLGRLGFRLCGGKPGKGA